MKYSLLFCKTAITALFFSVICKPVFSQNNTLKAVADTIDIIPGIPRTYDILANDTIPSDDTLRYVSAGGEIITCNITHGTKWVFTFTLPYWGYTQEVTGHCYLRTMSNKFSSASILFRIHDHSFDYLDINNVRALFSSSGYHFRHENAEFEVPKGSGKNTIFLNSLWLGGKDGQGQLHFSGGYSCLNYGLFPYRNIDYWGGPVMDSTGYSIYQDTLWNYVWNLKKSDIDYHRAHFWEAGYTPIHDILTWPGNGDTTLGQAFRLAPFSDRNGNGIYEPYDGDYPEIRGDQALYFIFNDDRHPRYEPESTGVKMRTEIHGMAYGFNMAEDSAFKNTVFLNYKIYNRSLNTYDSTFLASYSDIDIGFANDDYIGCDVERNMYFGYNRDSIDGTGQSYAYGANPPAQGVILLGGPLMDADGIDNPRYDNFGHQLCDFSVNGSNFGDGTADNERLGMQGFLPVVSTSSLPPYMTPPHTATGCYQMMCRKWNDSTNMIYGGNGLSGYGPGCNFMFPGESDTLNWGVGCAPPNGPKNWTEETAGINPRDQRGLGVTGPVTFKPGDVQELDIAFVWARDYTNPGHWASVDKLRHMADIVNKAFATNTLPNGNVIYGVKEPKKPSAVSLRIYPNPASDKLNIVFGQEKSLTHATIGLINSQGNCFRSHDVTNPGNTVTMDISGVPAGFYFIRVMSEEDVVVKKIVIL